MATEVIWMRVGDEDDYHEFDMLEDAAQYLADCTKHFGRVSPKPKCPPLSTEEVGDEQSYSDRR